MQSDIGRGSSSVSSSSSNGSTHQINDTKNRKKGPSSYTILIVDDEPDTTFTYKSVLEGAGFNVDAFNDPLEALSKLKQTYSSYPPGMTMASAATTAATSTKGPYDLMLLDIKMPKMNGFELYREIKKMVKENEKEEDEIAGKDDDDIKVCFITAHELYYEQLKREFPKIDVGCFIKKPINSGDLIKRIKQELLLED